MQTSSIPRAMLVLPILLVTGLFPAPASSTAVYEIPVTGAWPQTDLVVLVLRPLPYLSDQEHTFTLVPTDESLLAGVMESFAVWKTAIDEHGSGDIAGAVSFDVRLLPDDSVDAADVAEADIVVTNGRQLAGPGGIGIGMPCLVANTPNVSGASNQHIPRHEFGHCLGISHPIDFQPDEDVMSYGGGLCVSNLDLLGLHEAFGPAFGRTPARSVTIAAGDYEVYC